MIVSSRTPKKPPDRSEIVYLYQNGRGFYDSRNRGGPYTVATNGFLLVEDQSNRAGLTGAAIQSEDGFKLRME
jgi:hypothetical protein